MDDYIQSFEPIRNALNIVQQTFKNFHKGGFGLAQFVSNKPKVHEGKQYETLNKAMTMSDRFSIRFLLVNSEKCFYPCLFDI